MSALVLREYDFSYDIHINTTENQRERLLKRILSRTLLSLAIALSAVSTVQAKEEVIIVKPVGEYATIDMKPCMDQLRTLDTGSSSQQDKLIDQIKANPSKYNPVIFYHMSRVLFDQNKKDEAAFWFYAGQLRARYDANRCADVSARSAVAVLNQEFGAPINRYAMQDLQKLEDTVNKVVAFDEKTAHDYDNRWINLHGMGSMIDSLEGKQTEKVRLSLPEEQWTAIANKTREEYLKGFKEAMTELKSRK